MKVSPEYLMQLSHRVNTLHREKEKLLVQVKRTRELLRAQAKKGPGSIVNPGQRTGSIFLYVY